MRDAPQTIVNHFDLCVELRLVIQLLEIAAAASTEVGTRRFNADRRGFDYLFDGCKRYPATDAIDPHPNDIARRREGNEQRQSFRMRQSQATR